MNILRLSFRRFKEPLFLLFVAVALAVWYANKLNTVFQRDTLIPLYVEGVENPSQSGNNNYFEIFCRVRAKGYDFLLLKMFPSSKMIKLTAAELFSEENYNLQSNVNLDLSKIAGKISSRITDMEILNIHDSYIKIPRVQTIQKYVKISPDITINIGNGYMQLGEIDIEPSKVLISGSANILNNIDSVFTTTRVITSGGRNIIDNIELQDIEGVNFSNKIVQFSIATDRFTEQQFTLIPTIDIQDTTILKENLISIPSSVNIKLNSAQSIVNILDKQDFEVYASFNKDGMIDKNLYELKVRNLPTGVTVQSIEPQFITILRTTK